VPNEKLYSEVYIKNWARRKHGMIFVLSNRVVHTLYRDGSELVIDQEQHKMTTVNHNGVKLEFTKQQVDAMPDDEDVKVKLRLTKEMMQPS
jgi:hypothetical protein